MAQDVAGAVDAFFKLATEVPKTWDIKVTVPAEEVEAVWPVLEKYISHRYMLLGPIKNVASVTFVPRHREVSTP
jgi:hypothetical protein